MSATRVEHEGRLADVGILRDITDRREHERKLQRDRGYLDTFASGVSHDLQNPLSVVQGRLKLVCEMCDCGSSDCYGNSSFRVKNGKKRHRIDGILDAPVRSHVPTDAPHE